MLENEFDSFNTIYNILTGAISKTVQISYVNEINKRVPIYGNKKALEICSGIINCNYPIIDDGSRDY